MAGCLAARDGLTIENVGINPTRTGLLTILREMGARIELRNERIVGAEPVADIEVVQSELRGIVVPPELVPLAIDEFPILFIAAAAAKGTTVVSGAEELRKKETDRIAVMARALEAVGVEVEERPDGARIVGGRLRGGTVDSRGDHRIAMSFAVASVRAEAPIEILNTAEVATSFPNFLEVARAAGLRRQPARIAHDAARRARRHDRRPERLGQGHDRPAARAEARLALPRQRRPVSARGARGLAAATLDFADTPGLAEAAATLNVRFAPAAAGERV